MSCSHIYYQESKLLILHPSCQVVTVDFLDPGTTSEVGTRIERVHPCRRLTNRSIIHNVDYGSTHGRPRLVSGQSSTINVPGFVLGPELVVLFGGHDGEVRGQGQGDETLAPAGEVLEPPPRLVPGLVDAVHAQPVAAARDVQAPVPGAPHVQGAGC